MKLGTTTPDIKSRRNIRNQHIQNNTDDNKVIILYKYDFVIHLYTNVQSIHMYASTLVSVEV